MHNLDRRNRRLSFEPLEARRVLSCDFSGNGVCDVEDLDALYEAAQFSVSSTAFSVSLFPIAITHDFFVTSSEDVSFIQGSLSLQGEGLSDSISVYNSPLGSDVAEPSESLLEMHPETRDDSWIRTPDDSVSLSGSISEFDSTFVVSDAVDTGPTSKFHFARFTLTSDSFFDQFPLNFSGSFTTTAADGTSQLHPFSFDFPNRDVSRFNFDSDQAIDAGDIPGWLDAASVSDPTRRLRMGDVNLDGNIDSTDLGAVLNNFGQTSSDLGWGDGDLNMSGSVDSEDLGLVLNGFGFNSLATHESVSHAAEAIDEFAADLYEELQGEAGNIVFSPLSISTAFGMVYAGANGQTAEEISDVFHFGDDPEIHSSFSDLLSSYEQGTDPTELLVANSAWPSLGPTLRDEYVNAIGDDYRATVQSLDYGDPDGAAEIINQWIADNTNDRITDLVQDLSSDTVLVLANAMLFQSSWEVPFEPARTVSAPFTTSDGSVVNVDTMSTDEFDLIENHGFRTTFVDGFSALEMPFRGGAASMVLVLPPEGAASSVLPSSTLHQVNDWAGNPETVSSCVDIRLPKFETTVSTNLVPVLRDVLGMPSAFGPADFSGMFHAAGPFINQVKHDAFLKVDEAGAEAAAATIVEFTICFAAGTTVLTPDGVKPIEEIKVGDYVMSRDEGDPEGCVRPKIVEELYGGKKPVLEIQVAGQVIRPTDQHPFYVRDRGWIAAGELQIGDLLSTHHGEWKPVEAIAASSEEVAVYNFRIADYHTYFVGDDENAIWAHNCCGPEFAFHADRTFHFMIRDNINSTTVMMGRIDDPTQMTNDLEPGAPAAASEAVDLVTEDVDTADEVVTPRVDLSPFVPLRQSSGKLSLGERGEVLDNNAFEPCVGKDLSIETLVASLDRIQGRGQFAAESVDEVLQQDQLELDWVDSVDSTMELAFDVG